MTHEWGLPMQVWGRGERTAVDWPICCACLCTDRCFFWHPEATLCFVLPPAACAIHLAHYMRPLARHIPPSYLASIHLRLLLLGHLLLLLQSCCGRGWAVQPGRKGASGRAGGHSNTCRQAVALVAPL